MFEKNILANLAEWGLFQTIEESRGNLGDSIQHCHVRTVPVPWSFEVMTTHWSNIDSWVSSVVKTHCCSFVSQLPG